MRRMEDYNGLLDDRVFFLDVATDGEGNFAPIDTRNFALVGVQAPTSVTSTAMEIYLSENADSTPYQVQNNSGDNFSVLLSSDKITALLVNEMASLGGFLRPILNSAESDNGKEFRFFFRKIDC